MGNQKRKKLCSDSIRSFHDGLAFRESTYFSRANSDIRGFLGVIGLILVEKPCIGGIFDDLADFELGIS